MRHDRLWLLGGVLAAVVLVAFGYFFLIGPKHADAESIRSTTDATNDEVAGLRRQLVSLQQQYEHIDEYTAALQQDRAALPQSNEASALLVELQDASAKTGVTVGSVSVGGAVDLSSVAGIKVFALPVSLSVAGPTAKMNAFLEQLQVIQPRAVLISSVNFAPTSTANTNTANVTIALQAFYAPAA